VSNWNTGGDANVNAASASLDAATNSLRTQSSTFGSNLAVVQNRQDFTKNLINTLQTGAAGLTLADTNTEGANLLALQTRQSLATTALSLSNQAQSNILSILR
jgi:flagellin-like hook-associated protein FlgL